MINCLSCSLSISRDYKFIIAIRVEKGQAEPIEADSLTRELLDTNRCYILDCGTEVFLWMGRATSLDERKCASGAADVIVCIAINLYLHYVYSFIPYSYFVLLSPSFL